MDIKTQVVYRLMRMADIPQVQIVERKCFPVPWSPGAFRTELNDNDNACYIVAQLGDMVIGYAGIWIILDEGHITNIAVHPQFQGQGIGQRLMEEITRRAASRGVVRMTLEVRVSNRIARNLYNKLGFEVFGVRKGYYQDTKEDAFIMWKELTDDEKRVNVRDRD